MDIGSSRTLLETLRILAAEGLSLDEGLPYFTYNVAKLMRLHSKGRIAVGQDADLLVLDEKLKLQHVMANGRWHMKNGEQQQWGSYEMADTK